MPDVDNKIAFDWPLLGQQSSSQSTDTDITSATRLSRADAAQVPEPDYRLDSMLTDAERQQREAGRDNAAKPGISRGFAHFDPEQEVIKVFGPDLDFHVLEASSHSIEIGFGAFPSTQIDHSWTLEDGGALTFKVPKEQMLYYWQQQAIENPGAGGVTDMFGHGGEQGGGSLSSLTYSRQNFTSSLLFGVEKGGPGAVGFATTIVPEKDYFANASLTYQPNPALLNYSASVGFKDPNEFSSFLIGIKGSHGQHLDNIEFDQRVEFAINNIDGRFTAEENLGSHRQDERADLLLGFPLNDHHNIKLLTDVGYRDGVRVGAGLQIHRIPVVLDYNIEKKNLSLSVELPLGK